MAEGQHRSIYTLQNLQVNETKNLDKIILNLQVNYTTFNSG